MNALNSTSATAGKSSVQTRFDGDGFTNALGGHSDDRLPSRSAEGLGRQENTREGRARSRPPLLVSRLTCEAFQRSRQARLSLYRAGHLACELIPGGVGLSPPTVWTAPRVSVPVFYQLTVGYRNLDARLEPRNPACPPGLAL